MISIIRLCFFKRLKLIISNYCFFRSTLQQILLNRIGYDQFVNRITRLRESPHFKHASQYLQVNNIIINYFNVIKD